MHIDSTISLQKRVSPIMSRARSKRLPALFGILLKACDVHEAAILAAAGRYQKQVSSSLKKE